MVPASQRQDVLRKLHESHLGFTKFLEFAKLTVFWPGLRGDLKRLDENCRMCQENAPAQEQEPPRPTELPHQTWSRLGADVYKFKGNNSLVITDCYSRWIEIKHDEQRHCPRSQADLLRAWHTRSYRE